LKWKFITARGDISAAKFTGDHEGLAA